MQLKCLLPIVSLLLPACLAAGPRTGALPPAGERPPPDAAPAPTGAAPADRADLETLVAAEHSFCDRAIAQGVTDAFLSVFADDAVLFRPGPVNGREWMTAHPVGPDTLLTWHPVWAEVSSAGDLGYTTGPWAVRRGGPDAAPLGSGDYVSIWKRAEGGPWRLELDTGVGYEPTRPDGDRTPVATHDSSRPTSVLPVSPAEAKEALLQIDRAFSAAAATDPVSAYRAYLEPDARRYLEGSAPVIGASAILAAFATEAASMSWSPDAVDVARSGDLGYTRGVASVRQRTEAPAGRYLYVRIWRRAPDGSWKVALDLMNTFPQDAP